jgi:hypothetical protein
MKDRHLHVPRHFEVPPAVVGIVQHDVSLEPLIEHCSSRYWHVSDNPMHQWPMRPGSLAAMWRLRAPLNAADLLIIMI